MKKRFFACALLTLLALLPARWAAEEVGLTARAVEAEARRTAQIDPAWPCARAESEDTIVLLFYAPDRADHTFAVYQTHGGLSFGYFFRGGGSARSQERMDSFYAYDLGTTDNPARGSVLFSLNRAQYTRLAATYSGGWTETRELDPGEPFVQLVPAAVTEWELRGAHSFAKSTNQYFRTSGA